LTGTLGALGAIKPTVSSLVINNSGETLVYLSSAPITCAQLMVSHWLTTSTAGSQVVEIVAKSKSTSGTLTVDQGVEVNLRRAASRRRTSKAPPRPPSRTTAVRSRRVLGHRDGDLDSPWAT